MLALSIRDVILKVVSLLLSIAFLTFDVGLRPIDYFGQCKCWFLGEEFIELSLFKPVLEHPHKHFLV